MLISSCASTVESICLPTIVLSPQYTCPNDNNCPTLIPMHWHPPCAVRQSCRPLAIPLMLPHLCPLLFFMLSRPPWYVHHLALLTLADTHPLLFMLSQWSCLLWHMSCPLPHIHHCAIERMPMPLCHSTSPVLPSRPPWHAHPHVPLVQLLIHTTITWELCCLALILTLTPLLFHLAHTLCWHTLTHLSHHCTSVLLPCPHLLPHSCSISLTLAHMWSLACSLPFVLTSRCPIPYFHMHVTACAFVSILTV